MASLVAPRALKWATPNPRAGAASTRQDHSCPDGSLETGAALQMPSRSLPSALEARPRVGVLAPAHAYLREFPGIAVAPALVAPGRHRPVSGHDHKHRGVLLVALIAHHQARSLWGEARLDPLVSASAQLATHLNSPPVAGWWLRTYRPR